MGALAVEHRAQCKMNQDEAQGTFPQWAGAGRHDSKQSHDLDPRAARLPALETTQREELLTHIPITI